MGLCVIVASLLFGYQVAYASKIYHNIEVAGIDLSGKTKSEAKNLLTEKYAQILNTEFSIKSGDKEVKAKLSDTGLTINIDQTIDEAYNTGRGNKFFRQLVSSARTLFGKQALGVAPIIDQEKYNDFIKIAVLQFNTEPQNASLAVEQGQINEVAEKSGTVVNITNLDQQILGLINENSAKEVTLNSETVTPAVKIADFTEAKNYANGILGKTFTFTYEDKSYSPTKVEIGNWIKFTTAEGKTTGSVSRDAVSAYINKVAKNFEVIKKDKKINATDNSVIEEGQEGKLVDKNAALALVFSQVNSSNSILVPLATYAVAINEVRVMPSEGFVPGRFPGRYIDVDLATQRLCQIEGNAIVACYTISSGKASMPTPTGTFSITSKSPRAFSSKYGLYMPWWQQFNGPYGIHELPETNTWKEVPDHLGTPVSHGCVRLGVGPAASVYDWTSIGTPVYIHK